MKRLADLLWRRVEVSRLKYVLLTVGVTLTIGALTGLFYWGVVVQVLGLQVPPWEPGRFSPVGLTLVSGLVIAPVLETLVLVLLIGVAGWFTGRPGLRVIAGAVPLAMVHVVNAPAPVVAAGYALMALSGFLVFGIVYLAWRREGFGEAFWMCAGVHALHNGVVLLVVGVSGGFTA